MNSTVFSIINDAITTTTLTPEDEEDSTLYQSIYGVIYILLSVIELLMIAFFVGQFYNRHTIFRSPYFVIFSTEVFVNLLINIPSMNIYEFSPGIQKTAIAYSWYFVATCHITLIANRCTCLWFPLHFSTIWSFRNTFLIIIINFILPYAFSGFYLFKIYSTGFASDEETNIVKKLELIIITVLIFVTFVAVIFFSKRHVKGHSQHFTKIEKRLIYQSCAILICLLIDLMLYRIIMDLILIPFKVSLKFQNYFLLFADIFYVVQQILDVIALFILSEVFRNAFLKFYTFGYYGRAKVKRVNIITTV